MIYLFLYLADLVDGVLITIGLLVVALLIAMLVNFLNLTTSWDKDPDYTFIKEATKVVIILCIIGTIIPSKTVMYQMLGVKVGRDISSKVHIDKKLEKVSTLIDLELDKAIKEIK